MTDQPNKRHIHTQLVHAGERQAPPAGQPVSTPIYASATFTYDTMQGRRDADKTFHLMVTCGHSS